MAAGRTELLARLRQWTLAGKKGEDISLVALVHQDGDSHLKPIETWEIAPNADVEALCSAILGEADSDAAGSEERQIYYALGYFGDARPGSNSYGARQRIIVEGVPVFGEGLDGSIGSSEKMETPKQWVSSMGKMMLEHQKLTIPWANEMMRNYQRQVATLMDRVKQLEDGARKSLILQERLISRVHERQLALRKVIFWERKKEELGSIVIPMIPTILSAVAGKQLGPAPGANGAPKPPFDYAGAFQKFIVKIAPQQEKLLKVQSVLKVQQAMPAAGLVDAVQNGRPVDPAVLIEFMRPVDDAQMKQFQAILDEEEFGMFVDIHQALYEEFMRRKAEHDKAVAQAQEDMEGGEDDIGDPIKDGDAFRDEFDDAPRTQR